MVFHYDDVTKQADVTTNEVLNAAKEGKLIKAVITSGRSGGYNKYVITSFFCGGPAEDQIISVMFFGRSRQTNVELVADYTGNFTFTETDISNS